MGSDSASGRGSALSRWRACARPASRAPKRSATNGAAKCISASSSAAPRATPSARSSTTAREQAAHDTGAQVDYVFSGWNNEKMIQQLREAVAAHPDGIAMMGHPGDAAIMPLAEEAAKAGIKMMYQNVPVPGSSPKFGGGYVGAQLAPQGHALGEEAIRRFGLKKGDKAIVLGNFDQHEPRACAKPRHAKALETAGSTVIARPPAEWAADPNLAIPAITAASRPIPSQVDRLSRRPAARQRARLHAGGGQEAGRDLSISASTPARRSSRRSRAAGCS